jgi:hypothetical protein
MPHRRHITYEAYTTASKLRETNLWRIDNGPANCCGRSDMRLANIGIDNSNGLSRSSVLCQSRRESSFARVSSAKNQTDTPLYQTSAQKLLCNFISPIL